MNKQKILTKSDFLSYCVCPKDFWLRKNRPDIYQKPELTLFFQKLIREGYEVEKYAKDLFVDKENVEFQKQFQVDEGLNSNGVKFYAEVDVFEKLEEKELAVGNIYEVKSSSEIKTDLQHNHIKDITFQVVTAERSGIKINKAFIVHVNKEYVRNGEINPFELLVVEDVTNRVNDEKEQVSLMMDEALKIMNKQDVDISKCDCLYKSAGQRCDSFKVLNPTVPEYSVQQIFQGKKIKELVDDGIFDPKNVPEDFEMTERQKDKVYLQKIGKPNIEVQNIKEILGKFQYPLYFFDYESVNKPVPPLDGYKTNQHLVFQYSLHKLNEDGSLKHFEYLAEDMINSTKGLVEQLKDNIGPIGTVIVWHDTFEKGRNRELGQIHPETKEFFKDVNNRIFDLKIIFQKNYLHPDFKGSASIKKVLPVLLPELSYKNLNIQDGTMAMTEWERMVSSDISKEEKKEIRSNLLKYCELDTFAMVEIFKLINHLN